MVIVLSSLNLNDAGIRMPSQTDMTSRLPRAAKCVRKTVLEFLKSQLPAECQVHGVVTSGVVGK